MRETSKFGSRITRGFKKATAGTLAALMVVTALPANGLGSVTVEAANAVETEAVFRSYNPNNGEHLYTIDGAEHSANVGRGYKEESTEAWLAPKTSSTGVWRVYNPNSGEHLLVPESEANGLAQIGWNNEGRKMYSDDEKGVPIYRVYNKNATDAGAHHYCSKEEGAALVAAGWAWDNNGEPMIYGVDKNAEAAIESVALDNTTPKVGDTITATVSPKNASNVEKYQWYVLTNANDDYSKAESVSDKTSYEVKGEDAGRYIVVVATDTDGKEFVSEAAKVGAATATLIDVNGLQSDGTAFVGDTLRVTYTADLGAPASVAWYKDGAALESTTAQGNSLTFTINTDKYGTTANTADAQDAGEWYAVIGDQNGKLYESNHIKVVYKADTAVMKNVSFSEDYATPTVTLADKTDDYILNVTLNKDYDGVFWIFGDKEKDFKSTNAYAVDNALGGGTDGNEVGYSTKSDGVNYNVDVVNFDTQLKDSAVIGTTEAQKYLNAETGEATYKIHLNAATTANLKRGSKYYVVFDQDSLDTDDVSTDKNEDVNKTELITAPYVKAPVSAKISAIKSATTVAGWKAQLYADSVMEEKADWIDLATATATHYLRLYKSASSDTSSGTAFSTQATIAIDGGETGDANAKDTAAAPCVYAIYKAPAGIYGKDTLTITTDAVSVAGDAWDGVIVSVNSADVHDVDVTFNGLKTGGKLYLLKGKNVTKASDHDGSIEAVIADFDKDDDDTYVAVVNAKKNATKVTFDDVIDEIEDKANGDAYTVKFIPDSSEDYAETTAGTDESDNPLDVTQVQTTYKMAAHTYTFTAAAKESVGEASCYDQYGDEMATKSAVKFSNLDVTNPAMTGTLTTAEIDATGKVKVTNVDGSEVGAVMETKMSDTSVLRGTCTAEGTGGADSWTWEIINK